MSSFMTILSVEEFSLSQNYPNPSNPVREIRDNFPVEGKVAVEIYNLLSQKVATLVDKAQKAGYVSVR